MEKSFIFSLIFAVLVAIFALANADKVAINLLFTDILVSQAMVIFISTILGAVIMALLGMFKSFKLKKEIKDLKKQIEPLEIERDNLTALVDERGAEITNLNEKIKTIQEESEDLKSNTEESKENIEEVEDM